MVPSSEPTSAAGQPADPGAPLPPDAVDPELVALRRPVGRVGPLLSLSIVALCAHLLWILRADLRFSREGDSPRAVADAAALIADGDLIDRFVEVPAVPDRSFSAQVTSGESGQTGDIVMPALGTGDALWILVQHRPWEGGAAYDEVYRGRPRRLADLPLAGPLREHVAARPPAARHVAPELVRAALERRASEIELGAGGALDVEPTTPVGVVETAELRARVLVARSDERPDEATWTRALFRASLIAPDAQPSERLDGAWWYETLRGVGPDKARALLAAADLHAVAVEPLTRTHETTWDKLIAAPDGLRVVGDGSTVQLAWDRIERIALAVPHSVPPDAVILLTYETPGDYWYLLPLYAAMALFAALFVWALIRSLRPASA
jgi:hypothetical protein